MPVERPSVSRWSTTRNNSRTPFLVPYALKCVIDPHSFCRPDLSKQVERWGLRDAGFDYNIVAVFGSQSTGKSELLRTYTAKIHAETPHKVLY